MNTIVELLGIGVEPGRLTSVQVSLRGVLIFFYCIFLVRFADKRFLSRKTAFDAVLGFILASMMARAINGSAPFVPTFVGGFVIVLLHRAMAFLAVRWHAFGVLVKGSSQLVIDDGQPLMETLRKHNFSKADLLEDLRLSGVASPEAVQSGHIERNGQISVVRKERGS